MEIRSVGSRLREYRKSKGMSVTQIARKCGYAKQTWSNYENEKRQPTLPALDGMARLFGVSIDYLTGATTLQYNPRDQMFIELVSCYLALTDEKKAELVEYVKSLKEK